MFWVVIIVSVILLFLFSGKAEKLSDGKPENKWGEDDNWGKNNWRK
jgi:hypothetical protein